MTQKSTYKKYILAWPPVPERHLNLYVVKEVKNSKNVKVHHGTMLHPGLDVCVLPHNSRVDILVSVMAFLGNDHKRS